MSPPLHHSVGHALRGLRHIWRNERSFRIEVIVTGLVIVFGWWMQFTQLEWFAVAIACGFVLGAEVINTIIEDLLDHLHPDHHSTVGRIKDMAAGLVLTSAIIASAIGLIILWRHLA